MADLIRHLPMQVEAKYLWKIPALGRKDEKNLTNVMADLIRHLPMQVETKYIRKIPAQGRMAEIRKA